MDAEDEFGMVDETIARSQETLEEIFGYQCEVYVVCVERESEEI